jgi:O-antigen/teichoic acid export membrane protein
VLLRAALRPGLTTLIYVIGGIIGLVSSYLLIKTFAVSGAVYALTVSNCATAVVSILLVAGLKRKPVGASAREQPLV